MGKINVLDKSIAELIAAGEVVERPASVIKELLENSIDAGATAITVEIKNGGVKYIRIADNGSGISKEDVPKAFLRHATSKVVKADDLESIATLGFRGEALASVCAVSKVQLLTKQPDEEIGTLYEICAGEQILYEDAGCPNGTTIIVRDLFYNVESMYKKVECVTPEGKYELGQVECQQYIRDFLNTKVKTNIWNREFVFPDTEYRIYFSHPGDGIAFRVKKTDEAIEIWEREFYTSDKHHVYLIDN